MRIINPVPLRRYYAMTAVALVGLFAFQAVHAPNRVKADDLPVVYESGWLDDNTTWTAGNVYYILSSITVPDGVTLTIEPGVIIKVQTHGDGITVMHGGVLDAAGTNSDPVIFTSAKDDGLEGDTNNDGATTGNFGDYGSAIILQNGTANITHTTFRYGSSALGSPCGYYSGNITITDSTLNNKVSVCDASTLTIERNTFDVPGGYGAALSDMDDPTGFKLSGTDKNNFISSTASGNVVHIESSFIPNGATWDISGSSGVVLAGGAIWVSGTLNLDAGVTFKADHSALIGIEVYNHGTLNTTGTSSSPVIITSIKDDVTGGDAQGDGATTGSVGEFNAAVQVDAGGHLSASYTTVHYASGAFVIYNNQADFDHITLSHILTGFAIHNDGEFKIAASDISYAAKGIQVYDGASVAYRGSITNSDKGIVACDWHSYCMVDAAYTDWGSADGPFATNPADNLVCGSVSVSPWKHSSSTYNITPSMNVRNCSGASPTEGLDGAVAHFNSAVAARQIDCSNAYQDACNAVNMAYECLSGAVDVAASTTPFPLPSANPGTNTTAFIGGFETGANTYINGIEYETIPSNISTLVSGAYSLVGTFYALANAYNSCAP
jgi:hypothetical protein